MEDGRIQKYILYGELALGRRTTGRRHLRYKDVCIRDMKAVDIDTMSLERDFLSTLVPGSASLVPGSGRFQLTHLMGYS